MNQARQQLSQGIPPQDVDSFRQWVANTVGQVEAISRQHYLYPEQLSTPTYRAYLYLKNLDLKNVPVSPDSGEGFGLPKGEKKLSIRHLVAFCHQLQDQIGEIAQKSNRSAIRDGEEQLRMKINITLNRIESLFQNEGIKPGELPPPTQRAYLWLKFLMQPGMLHAHLDSLQLAYQSSRQAPCLKKLPPRLRNTPIQISFYNIAALYRMKMVKGSIQITANEAFITGPENVIQDLVCAALLKDSQLYVATLRSHVNEEKFSEALQPLQISRQIALPDTKGQAHDLQKVFNRVNSAYFNNEMEQPRLTWNRTITHRKLGHYQPQTDTVMISITLDQPDIPTVLIDFIMYHELLHKKLGIHQLNGRRYPHNKQFREEERKYKEYAKAQESLQLLHERIPGLKLY